MQMEVLGTERRRRWSYEEKVRLIEETMQSGETVCGVARRHGLAQSLLFTWRRQARQGRLGSDAGPALVPVEITSSPDAAPTGAPPSPSLSSTPRIRAGMIEIELGGCCVRVDRDVDTEANRLEESSADLAAAECRLSRESAASGILGVPTRLICDSLRRMNADHDAGPDDVAALKEALAAERAKGLEIAAELAVARAKASEDEALIASQKLQIAKLRHQI
jgi:transposase